VVFREKGQERSHWQLTVSQAIATIATLAGKIAWLENAHANHKYIKNKYSYT
jgi:hypothetical protein